MSTWMVVEDEPDLYDTLLALFEIWSIEGVAFTNGSDALNWIEDMENGNVEVIVPELAILDIRLPDIMGPDVGHRVRQSRQMRDTAVVLITAYHLTPTEEAEVMARADADALMYKPLPAPNDFRTALQAAIEHRQKRR